MDHPSIVRRLNQDFKRDAVHTQLEKPWFGHFVLQREHKESGYKIGEKECAEKGIIDWRHALASAFYELEPGDDFDMDDYQTEKQGKDRYISLKGVVGRQTKVQSKSRSIQRATIKTPEELLHFVAAGETYVMESLDSDRINFMDGLPDVRSVLTKEQYRIITSADQNPVVIQGQAGSGKTTVALYRLSWLAFPKEDALVVAPENVLIVMFNKALQRFISSSLEELGLEKAQVSTFHAWALEEVKKSYEGELELNTDWLEYKDSSTKIKKSLGLLKAMDEFVVRQTNRLIEWLEDKLAPYEATSWLEEAQTSTEPIVQRMIRLRKKARIGRDQAQGREKVRLEQIYDVFKKGVTRLRLYKEELLNFLTDQELLGRHLPFESAESIEALGHYQKALQSIGASGRRPGPCIAFEDLALLLRLIQLKNGGLVDKQDEDHVFLYDHLMIDEAQDFGGLEMKVLLSAVRTKSGVSIVGDTNQKIVPEADFMGWDALISELGVAGATVTRLEVGHRSTGPIMNLAAKIINEPSQPGRLGVMPSLIELPDENAQLAWLADRLSELSTHQPMGHICIVCRHPKQAKDLTSELQQLVPTVNIRFGHNKDFEFSAGVTVTNLRQVKGLEFDLVFILEPNEDNYPARIEGRRNLYTALTRAKDELVFVSSTAPCALLIGAIDAGLIEPMEVNAIEPVQFTEEDDDPF